MSEQPLVTVGISTYNRKDFLVESLESVINQTYPALDIIVVDDGSTDDTCDMMREKYPNIRYLQKPNGGDASAKNLAVQEARGEYVVFNDSDDVFLPDAVERLYRRMTGFESDRTVCAYGTYITIDVDGNRLPTKRKMAKMPEGDILPDLLAHILVNSSGTLMPVKLFRECGCYDESLRVCHDWKISLEMALRADFAFVEEPVFLRRRHNSNISSHSYQGELIVCRVLEDFLASHPDIEELYKDICRRRRGSLYSRVAREAARSKEAGSLCRSYLKTALANDFKMKYFLRYLGTFF